jgi:hypothetical protein|tara:strand:- start:156 stop:320 length:165 start_codon:yes stop_codon:yes gene_type:complete
MPVFKVTKLVTKKTVYYTTAEDYYCAEDKVENGDVEPVEEEEVSVDFTSEEEDS